MTPTERIARGDGERITDELVVIDGKVYFFKKSHQKWRPVPSQEEGWKRVERARKGIVFDRSTFNPAAARQARSFRRIVVAALPYQRHMPLEDLVRQFGEKVQDALADMDEDGQIVFHEETSTVCRVMGTPSERINEGEGEILAHMARLGDQFYHQMSNGEWHHYTNQQNAQRLWNEKKKGHPAERVSGAPRRFVGFNDIWANRKGVCPHCNNAPLGELEYCLYCDRYFLDDYLPAPDSMPTKSDRLPKKVGHLTPLYRVGGDQFVFQCDCGREVERIHNNIKHNDSAACDHCSWPVKALDEWRQEVATENFAWARAVAIKIGKRFGVQPDEAESAGTLGFVKAVSKYEGDGSADDVRGFCYLRIKQALWRICQNEKDKHKRADYEQDFLEEIPDRPDSMTDIREVLRSISKMDAGLVHLIAVEKYPLRKIGERFGMNVKTIQDKYQYAIARLTEKYLREDRSA